MLCFEGVAGVEFQGSRFAVWILGIRAVPLLPQASVSSPSRISAVILLLVVLLLLLLPLPLGIIG